MLVGSILNNLGNNLMSLGHSEQKEIDDLSMKRTMSRESLKKHMESDTASKSKFTTENMEETLKDIEKDLHDKELKGTWWLTGTVIFVVGALMAFVSFGFAAQSLLAALESVQFVSNVFFHKYVHGMAITPRILASTSAILAGSVVVVAFSSHKSHVYDAEAITHMYETNASYHWYAGVSGFFWFLAHGVYAFYEKGRLVGTYYWHHNKVEPFAFVVSATLIGTQSVLHAKCLSMLMMLCINGDDQFQSPYAHTVWACLATWIATAVIYVQRINKGLQMYPPSFFIPSMTVCFAFFTIVAGGLFFSEFQEQSNLQLAMFGLGTFLIFGGVSQLEASESEPVAPDPSSADDSPMRVEPMHRKPSVLLPAPTSSVVIENRETITEELNSAMQRASEVITETVQRVRAGSGGAIDVTNRLSVNRIKVGATDESMPVTIDTGGGDIEMPMSPMTPMTPMTLDIGAERTQETSIEYDGRFDELAVSPVSNQNGATTPEH